MKMATIFKETTSKTKKGEKENIISMKVVSCSLNSTLDHRKFPKSNSQMVQSMLGNKRTGQGKDQVKRLMLTAAFMKANGKMTKNMETESFNTLTALSTTVSGKKIFVMDSEPIFIPMETSTKVIGIMIFRKVWELITTQMETFTKENGKVANLTVKEIISIKAEKPFTKATGKTEKKKVLESSL